MIGRVSRSTKLEKQDEPPSDMRAARRTKETATPTGSMERGWHRSALRTRWASAMSN
jgi:hypothetical protein